MHNVMVTENGNMNPKLSQFVKVTGNFNYFLHVEIKKVMGTTNSSITVQTFTSPDRTTPVDSNINWIHISSAANNPKMSQLNFHGHTYSLSPIDLNKMVEVKITPAVPSFQGECTVSYGPIGLDKLVEMRLVGSIKNGGVEIPCEGTVKGTQKRFDVVRGNRDVLEFFDRSHNAVVDTIELSKDTMASPSYYDSLMITLSDPGKGRKSLTRNEPKGEVSR
jgi:hypothetical protein